ncbi:hypothetical protein L1887_32791 [Cichorium endivia]|nr:hypothetical protein L1887_32791 [Cichorium endivia]
MKHLNEFTQCEIKLPENLSAWPFRCRCRSRSLVVVDFRSDIRGEGGLQRQRRTRVGRSKRRDLATKAYRRFTRMMVMGNDEIWWKRKNAYSG